MDKLNQNYKNLKLKVNFEIYIKFANSVKALHILTWKNFQAYIAFILG